VGEVSGKMVTQYAAPKRGARPPEIAWREKLRKAWLLKIGTVLTAAEVRDLVAEHDAMCAERTKGKK
jgi:hypothetical protein